MHVLRLGTSMVGPLAFGRKELEKELVPESSPGPPGVSATQVQCRLRGYLTLSPHFCREERKLNKGWEPRGLSRMAGYTMSACKVCMLPLHPHEGTNCRPAPSGPQPAPLSGRAGQRASWRQDLPRPDIGGASLWWQT
jgi:hypothetical protein